MRRIVNMSMMTKKHYDKLAKELSYTYETICNCDPYDISLQFKGLVDSIIEICAADNHKFDVNRFKKAIYGD
jgi:hypothetical protein